MLYFNVNYDNFKPIYEEVKTTVAGSEEKIKELHELDVGNIETLFFDRLFQETGLHVLGHGALNDIIGIPNSAVSIDDENSDSDFLLMVRYIIAGYSKVPIYAGKSLEDLGIRIEYIRRIKNRDVNAAFQSYMNENNLHYLEEEVLWKNMTDDEKAGKFNEYLSKIDARGNELIVIDPYLFNDETDDYCKLIVKVLKMSHCQKVIVLTEKSHRHYKANSFVKIKTELDTTPYYERNPMLLKYQDEMSATPILLEVKDTDEFHDRFWIADRKKGFNIGTSFNGIGKRISSINFTSDEDVADIVNDIQNKGLI